MSSKPNCNWYGEKGARDSNHGFKKEKKKIPHVGISIKTGDTFRDKNGCLLVNFVELRPITRPSLEIEYLMLLPLTIKKGDILFIYNCTCLMSLDSPTELPV